MAEGSSPPPGMTVLEWQEQTSRAKALYGEFSNLNELLEKLNKNTNMGELRTRLTNDLEFITRAFAENSSQLNVYLNNLEKKFLDTREEVETAYKNFASVMNEAFNIPKGKEEEFKTSLNAFINAAEDADGKLKTALEASINTLQNTLKKDDDFIKTFKLDLDEIFKAVGKSGEDIDNVKQALIDSRMLLDKDIEDIKKIDKLEGFAEFIENLQLTEGHLKKKSDLIRENLLLDVQEIQQREQLRKATQAQFLEETRLGEIQKLNNESRKKTIEGFATLSDKIFGASKNAGLFSSSLMNFMTSGETKGRSAFNVLKDGALGFSTSLFSLEGSLARVENFLNERLVKSTFKFAESVAKLNRETGGMTGGGMTGPAFTGGAGLRAFARPDLATYGIGMDKFLEAQTSLLKQFNQLNTLSGEQQTKIIGNAAKLTNLGVSTESYAKILQGYFGAVGKSVDAADEAVNRLAKDAIGMGLNVSQYLSKFEQLMPKIIAYGREASTIFKELTALSQATKGIVSEADMSAIADRFSTFEGAAEQVSKLNAMLGGTSISIMDVMGKDPAEVAFAIKRAAEESGLSFDRLNRGYKQLMAELFGGDMQKAASFFNANLADANGMLMDAAANQEELNRKAEESATAQQKLATALDNVRVAFTPMLDLISYFAKGLTKIQSFLTPIGTWFLGLGGLIGLAVVAWRTFATAATAAIRQIAAPLEHLSAQLTKIEGQLLQTRGLAASGAMSSYKAGAPGAPIFGGAGKGAMGMMLGMLAIGAITAGIGAASSSGGEESKIKYHNALISPPLANATGYNRQITNLLTGEKARISDNDALIGSQAGETLHERVFGSERVSSDSSRLLRESNSRSVALREQVSSTQSNYYEKIGKEFGKHFVEKVVEVSKSSDKTISNIFGGKGETHVHVVAQLDGQNIASNVEKRIVNSPDRIANAVMGKTTSVV